MYDLSIGLAIAVDRCSAVTVTNNAPAKFSLGVRIVTRMTRDATGNDTITTGNGNDYVNGGAGVDTCYALGGTNTVLGCEVSP